MIRHTIIWTLKDTLTSEQKRSIKHDAKVNLESLCGMIPGLLELKVVTDPLPGSTGELMLDSLFTSVSALKAYATHPEHVRVADTFVRPYTATRACVDYEVIE